MLHWQTGFMQMLDYQGPACVQVLLSWGGLNFIPEGLLLLLTELFSHHGCCFCTLHKGHCFNPRPRLSNTDSILQSRLKKVRGAQAACGVGRVCGGAMAACSSTVMIYHL